MEWTIVLSLIIAGLALLLVEILFIPGTTVVGVIGIVCLITGMWLSFRYFPPTVSWIVSGATIVASASAVYFSFSSGMWKPFALRGSSDSKVNENLTQALQIGMEGKTISALRPVGNADFLGQIVEVKSMGDYISPDTKIRIKKIELNQIFIEPIN